MTRHISLLLPNVPGAFYEVAERLASDGINIWAHHVANVGRHALLQMVCIPHERAMIIISEKFRYYATESEVIAVRIPNVPGQLLQILRVIKDCNLNITHVYSTYHPSGDAIVLLDLKDSAERQAATAALLRSGLDVLSSLRFE